MSETPTRSDASSEGTAPRSGLGARLAELRAAALYLTGTPAAALDAGEIARGTAFFPALGLVLGTLVAAPVLALEPLLPHPAVAAAALALLWAASRGRLPRALAQLAGRGALAVLLVVKAAALVTLSGGALALALLLAVTLGRWALVVQAYGSQAADGDAVAATLAREPKFREFGIASVTAMAATLALSNAIGVLLLVAVASATIGVRIAVHRRLGGVTETSLAAGGEIAETAALLVCAALVALARAGAR